MNKGDCAAARALIIELLDSKKEQTAKDIGLKMDLSGRVVGQLLRELVAQGKAKKIQFKTYTPKYTLAVASKKAAVAKSRHLLVYKVKGILTAEVLLNEQAAMERAKELTEDCPGTTVFYGEATRRISTPKPKARIEDI